MLKVKQIDNEFGVIGGYAMTAACCLQASPRVVSNFGILVRTTSVDHCNVC